MQNGESSVIVIMIMIVVLVVVVVVVVIMIIVVVVVVVIILLRPTFHNSSPAPSSPTPVRSISSPAPFNIAARYMGSIPVSVK